MFIASGVLLFTTTLYFPLRLYLLHMGIVGSDFVLTLLVKSYKEAPSTAVKQQVGLVVICGFLAFTPLLTLSILPKLLLNVTVLPPEWAFLFLIAIPLGYGYAIAITILLNWNAISAAAQRPFLSYVCFAFSIWASPRYSSLLSRKSSSPILSGCHRYYDPGGCL